MKNWGGGMGQPGFTQGFADFFTGEGYYADPRGTYLDGGWNISDKPIDVGPRMGGVLDPYGNPGGGPSLWPQPGRPNDMQQPFQTFASPSGGKGAEQFPWLQGYQGSMSDINAIEDYRMSQIDQNVQGTVPRYLNTPGSSRPNDLMQPIQQGAGLASLQKGYMT